MVVGYVRLSKDDNKRDYVSIENQKLILSQYAIAHGYKITKWYEDDGFSGYTFERPGFQALKQDLLQGRIDTVLSKDLSRIGRHNAKVLLFLEEVKELGKQIILTEDGYDSRLEEDDSLGIKTWYNERYIKDTSKKIKKAMRARQRDGTLALNTPMGYVRNGKDKTIIEIDEEAAKYIRRIFALYLEGYGFRTIAYQLDQEGVPTPSELEKRKLEYLGKPYNKKLALLWSPKMVGDIIKNDVYIGTLRYHKRERFTVHGKEVRIREGEQYIFPNNHPAIIDNKTFDAAQDILNKRRKTAYRGKGKANNNYCGLLYCKTCGHKMTAIHRRENERYYLCGTYNTKGKQFCSQSYRIKEAVLDDIIRSKRASYINENKEKVIDLYRKVKMEQDNLLYKNMELLEEELKREEDELKLLLLHEAKAMVLDVEHRKIIEKAQEELQKEKVDKIKRISKELSNYKEKVNKNLSGFDISMVSKEQLLEKLIETDITRFEIEQMLDRIIVDREGGIEVKYKKDYVPNILGAHIFHSV